MPKGPPQHLAGGIALRPGGCPDTIPPQSRMSFFDITSEPSRWARRGLLLLGGLLALGQARAQLAPPPPPARTSIIISNGKSLAGWRAPLGDWKLVRTPRRHRTTQRRSRWLGARACSSTATRAALAICSANTSTVMWWWPSSLWCRKTRTPGFIFRADTRSRFSTATGRPS